MSRTDGIQGASTFAGLAVLLGVVTCIVGLVAGTILLFMIPGSLGGPILLGSAALGFAGLANALLRN